MTSAKIMRVCNYCHSVFYLRHKKPKEIPVTFHSDSNCDYHFIIRELAEEFKEKFQYMGENTDNNITFSVPIEKQENEKIIKYKIILIDSIRFMASSLSCLANNLVEGLHKDCKSRLEYMTAKDGFVTFKFVDCSKTYEKEFDEDLFK